VGIIGSEKKNKNVRFPCPGLRKSIGGFERSSAIMDPGLIKQINQRLQEELLKKEMEWVQYSLAELERLMEKRHQDLASLQVDLRGLIQKHQNRLKQLKTSR
jgi:hypothetical protein